MKNHVTSQHSQHMLDFIVTMFGVTSAPEIYQHAIQQALHGCEGLRNIPDDIILHSKDEKLLKRGLTLDVEKCKFKKMPRLEIMVYLLQS